MREEPIVTPAGLAARPQQDGDLLIIDDDDRYSRLRLIPWWRQERLRAARILVVGAGALGNEVLKNLALLGLGTVLVIDRDEIELSNLSRSVLFRAEDAGEPKAIVAARRARELNPDSAFHGKHGDIITDVGLGVFADVDLVIGCLDNREARLWVNRQCWKVGTPWIDAGIQEIQGVVKVFVPPDSACYECAMTRRDYELLNLRYSCPLLPREDLLAGKVPTAPTIASMMGALQVQEALKLLHDLPVAAGCAHVFNGVGNQFYTTQLPLRPDCLSHEVYPPPIALPLGHAAPASTLFAAAAARGPGDWVLELDRDLLVSLICPPCGWNATVMRPRSQVSQAQAVCPSCGQLARPETLSRLEASSALAAQPLAALGVPPYDIVRLSSQDQSLFFLLQADHDGWVHAS